MADTLEIFGTEYTGVTGIKATDNNGNIKTYIRPQGTKSITQNGTGIDVTEYAAVDVSVSGGGTPTIDSLTVTPTTSQQTFNSSSVDGYKPVVVNAMPSGSASAPSTISGSSATVSTGTNTLTMSKTVSVTPVVSAGYVASGTATNSSVSLTASVTTQAAQTIHPSSSNQTISSGRYLTGTQTINAVTTTNLTADNIKSGVIVQVGDASDSDCVTSVTGTYSGGGGTSKNVQILQSTTRTTSTSYTKLCGDITVAKTGKYDIYWTYFRTSTSGTWGSQLYIGDSAYGSAQTTYSNHVSNVHLSNVSLTENQKVSVYGRSRGSNYYAYVGQLTIIES